MSSLFFLSGCTEKKKSGSLKRTTDVKTQNPSLDPKASFSSPTSNSIQKASLIVSGTCEYPGEITLSGDIAGPLEISCNANDTFASEILLLGADGSKTVVALQQFGEKQASANLILVKDSTNPDCAITGLSSSYNTTGLSFNAECTDINLDLIECRLDSASFASCSNGVQNLTSLSEGPHTFEIRANDIVQNQSLTASASFSIDTTGPSGFSSVGVATGSDVIFDNWLRAEGDPIVNFVPPSDAVSLNLEITSSDLLTTYCSSGSLNASINQYTFAGCVLSSGFAYKIRMQALDSLGNQGPNEHFTFNKPRNVNLSLQEGSSYDFGSLTTGSVAEKTLHVQLSAGPATSVSSSLTGAGFSFKGGSYPGVGGTCSSTIVADCTIIINFQKSQAGSFAGNLQLTYSNGFENSTVSISLAATTTLPLPTELRIQGLNAVVAGDCLSINFTSTTETGVASAVATNTTVNLTVNNGTGVWYSDALCSASITSGAILSGQSQLGVFFKSVTSGQSLTLVGTTSAIGSATHYLNVGSSPVSLLISGSSQSVLNSCRAYEVSRIDALGNKVGPNATQNFNLSVIGSAATFSDASCSSPITSSTIAAYSQSTSIYLKVTALETVTLNAADPGAILTSDLQTVAGVSSLSWWDGSWPNRVRVNLNNLDQTVSHTNMQVLLRINSSKVDYSKIQANGEDLRIIASDDTTVLPFEIESWNPSGESLVWVRVPSISASSDSDFIQIYYGNSAAVSGQNPTVVWSTHSSVWHLQENPSGTAPQFKDATASAWNGTAENSPTSSVGVIGNGLNLNGNFDGFDVGHDLSTIIGYSSTLSFWIKTNQVGNNTNWMAPGLTGVEQAGGVNDIFFGWMDASGKLGVTAGDGAGSKSNFIVNDNAWRHVTISRNHTTGATKFYINGVLNGSGNPGAGAKTTPFSKFGQIADTGGTPVELDGLVDEIRLTTGVSTDDRVKAEFKYLNNTHLIWSAAESY